MPPLITVPSPKLMLVAVGKLAVVPPGADVVPEVVDAVVAVTASGAWPLLGVTLTVELVPGAEMVSVAAFDILFAIDGFPTALTYNVYAPTAGL